MKHILFLLFFIVPAVYINAQNVGIGMSDPQYKLDVQGTCYIRGNNYVSGFVGIGTTSPIFKLDVIGGSIRTSSNLFVEGSTYIDGALDVDGAAYIEGNLTVSGGKGVLQNSHGSGQLKYYTRTATANTGNLLGFAMSPEFSIGFAGGVFSSPPKVFVGDIVSTGGTVGQLYRVQLITYGATTTGCKARLLNTSPNTVNYSITWNIMCIGE